MSGESRSERSGDGWRAVGSVSVVLDKEYREKDSVGRFVHEKLSFLFMYEM